jgi:N-acyl-L-homoserine lactone synthetase
MCSALDISYDKRVLKWRVKYLDEYPDLELDEYDESSPYAVLN